MKPRIIRENGPRTVMSSSTSPPVTTTEIVSEIRIECPSTTIKGDFKRPNPWNYSINDRRFPTGRVVHTNISTGKTTYMVTGRLLNGSIPSLSPFDSNSLTMAYNDALSRLSEKVRGGLDLSVALLESSATARMIRALGTWNRWFRGFGAKRWASEWLGYTYGWVPLVSDIYNAADELTHVANAKLVFESAGGAPVTTALRGSTNLEGVPMSYNTVVHSAKCGARIKVKLKPNQTKIQSISRWTSLNPASILWETLPYSFVVDWFYDVGSYLRDYETAITYNSIFESGYVSWLTAYNLTYQGAGTYDSFGTRVIGNFSNHARVVNFNRAVLSAYPLPRAPVIKTDLSWKRVVSAGALLAQQLLR